MEWLKEFSSYCGAIVTIIGLVVLIFKPIRVYFVNWVGKLTNREELMHKIDHLTLMSEEQTRSIDDIQTELKKQSENQLSTSRNTILMLTRKYTEQGSIPARELEAVLHLADSYFALGGNSFIEACVAEVKALPITYD